MPNRYYGYHYYQPYYYHFYYNYNYHYYLCLSNVYSRTGTALKFIQLCKLKYGSIRSRAPYSCCIPCVPLRIACAPLEKGVNEGCSYYYDLETVACIYEKKKKNSK